MYLGKMESHRVCLFVTDLFYLARCLQGSSILYHMSQFPPIYAEFHCILGAYLVAQIVKNQLAMRETLDHSLRWEDPLEKDMTTHSSIFLPGELQGQRSLVGYSL